MYLDLIFPTPVWTSFLNFNTSELLEFYNKLDKSVGRCYSNSGGYQSDDFTKYENDILLEFCQCIEQEADKACNDFGIAPLEVRHLWFNGNAKNSSNTAHIHPGSILSGVYYIQATNASGEILFHRDTKDEMFFGFANPNNVTFLNSCSIGIAPENDKLVLFPSNLLHSVSKNTTEDDRISVSFNLGPRRV